MSITGERVCHEIHALAGLLRPRRAENQVDEVHRPDDEELIAIREHVGRLSNAKGFSTHFFASTSAGTASGHLCHRSP
jgi:hypothetical protein